MGQQKNASSLYIAVAFLALALNSEALAQSTTPAASAKGSPAIAPAKAGDDKVDISDLESKYWAPKDTDFSVVQNRTYSKANRFMIAPQFGTVINDPYSDGNVMGLTANYFWSERMGVQLTYLKGDLEENDNTKNIGRLSATSGAYPDHGEFTSYYGVGYNIVPFYAKMSFWGKRIIYFDMAFTPHVGMTTYDQVMEGGNRSKSSFTYGLDVTQFFFFSRWFAVRADLKNQWRGEETVKYRTSSGLNKGQKTQDKTVQDTMFLLGAEFYF